MTRPKSTLRSDKPLSLAVRPNDVDRSWLVRVSDGPRRRARGRSATSFRRDDADVVLEGTAEQLYLALWNRSDEVQGEGFELWRRTAQVTWA